MLHSLSPDARWCGPSAVSILTGEPYSQVMPSFRRMQQIDDVEGVWPEETQLALLERGYQAKPIELPRLMRLRTFLAGRTPEQVVTPLLIWVHKHMLTAHYGFAADNWTKRPVPIAEFPKLNRLVYGAYLIRRIQ